MKTFARLDRLEYLLIEEAHRRYQAFDFPEPSMIGVVRREQSSGGRRTYLAYEGRVLVGNGLIPLAQAFLPSLDLLVTAELEIVSGLMACLHLIVAGDCKWSGEVPEPIELLLG